MNIEFSKEQYLSLLKMVYLGNWMINSYRTETIKEFDELEEYLFTNASKFGLTEVAGTGMGNTGPSQSFEKSLEHFIDEYNESNMWEELISMLIPRDLINEFGEEKIKEMDQDSYLNAYQRFQEKYENEFTKNGIRNLHI